MSQLITRFLVNRNNFLAIVGGTSASSTSSGVPAFRLALQQCRYASKATAVAAGEPSSSGSGSEVAITTKKKDPAKDRSIVIPVETSIRYLQSAAYKETYGDVPVWVPYRRNFKGQFAPKLTRKTCIRQEELTTGNACPICRDEYLVLDYENVELLKQFISPFNGEIIGTEKTGLCRKQHFNLLVAMEKAKDYGTITTDVPFRDYSHYDYEGLARAGGRNRSIKKDRVQDQ